MRFLGSEIRSEKVVIRTCAFKRCVLGETCSLFNTQLSMCAVLIAILGFLELNVLIFYLKGRNFRGFASFAKLNSCEKFNFFKFAKLNSRKKFDFQIREIKFSRKIRFFSIREIKFPLKFLPLRYCLITVELLF